jgi:hypothetical protein
MIEASSSSSVFNYGKSRLELVFVSSEGLLISAGKKEKTNLLLDLHLLREEGLDKDLPCVLMERVGIRA